MTDPLQNPSGLLVEELALLAHDIRASLTDVLVGLDLFDPAGFEAKDRQQLDRIKASGEGLARLLEVALAKVLGTAPANLRMEAVHLPNLLDDQMRRWACSGTPQKPLARIIITAADDLPEVILCNRVAMERVLSNLLSNAITHSGGNVVTLDVRQLDAAQQETAELCFTVTDQGPGFPEALCTNGAGQVEGAQVLSAWRNNEGHGLGLSVAYSLAKGMGGQITLRNLAAGGGAATLRLPFQALPSHDANNQPQDEMPFAGRKVLLADDSATQLLALSLYFGQVGVQTTMVRDGVSALAALKSGGFDAAFLDQDMLGLTGSDICKQLCDARTGLADIPLVILSGHQQGSHRQHALEAGACLVLYKPINSAAVLVEALHHALDIPSDFKADEANISGPNKTGSGPKTLGIDPTDFLHLLEIAGPDAAAELITRFQADLAAVDNQLRLALPALDWKNLQDASHVLSALAGTAGAHPLADAARSFNIAATDLEAEQVQLFSAPLLRGLAKLITYVDTVAAGRQE